MHDKFVGTKAQRNGIGRCAIHAAILRRALPSSSCLVFSMTDWAYIKIKTDWDRIEINRH